MFDFALTNKGDLIFEQNDLKQKPMKIQFAISKGKMTKIGFDIIDSYPLEHEGGLKLSFDVGDLLSNKKAMVIFDGDAKVQAIKIRLLTALGELATRKNIGSLLEAIRHQPLFDNATAKAVEATVKTAISDIVPKAEIRVEPVVTAVRGYVQSMRIYIFEDGFLIFKYDLEG